MQRDPPRHRLHLPGGERHGRIGSRVIALDALYRVAGRLSLVFDPLRRVSTSPDSARARTPDLDKTGFVAFDPAATVKLHDDGVVLYVRFESFAHSLWRAQELSLFRAHLSMLPGPRLDFGTGDGSFTAALFDRVDFGADNDPEALEVAARRGLYSRLLLVEDGSIPLEDASVASVMSNSVLEHVVDLDRIVAELRRVLRPGGTLMFTVPVPVYRQQLATYFGQAAAARINEESSHHNLMDSSEWVELLGRHGFIAEAVRCYQPPRFTFWYRMSRLLGQRGLARFWPSLPDRAWRWFGDDLVAMVRSSISDSTSGANIFVVAR